MLLRAIFFLGRNCRKDEITSILGVEEIVFPVRYLGLSLFAGMIKRDMCLPLLDKMRAKLDLWKGRLLSMEGHMELIISTLAAFNIFWASAISIPKSVTEEADKICRQFLWGIKKKKREGTLLLGTWCVVTKKKAVYVGAKGT